MLRPQIFTRASITLELRRVARGNFNTWRAYRFECESKYNF